jgi:hypothetical protein
VANLETGAYVSPKSMPGTCSYPLMTSRTLKRMVLSAFLLILYTYLHPIGLWCGIGGNCDLSRPSGIASSSSSSSVGLIISQVPLSTRAWYSILVAAIHCSLYGLDIASRYEVGSPVNSASSSKSRPLS